MAKKKATMTLKDFHGGSIPSDLPLPSAPGVTVRMPDRSGWVNPTGRTDQRSRLNVSSSSRHFDDTTTFLSHASFIGRNFDEDERKPLDGLPGPRRTVGDEAVFVSPHSELKHQPFYGGRLSSQHGPAQVSPPQSQQLSPYLGRVSGGGQAVGSQGVYGNSGHGVPGSVTNAWSMRKEAANASEPVQSASTAASKLIHASAIDKVTSGRWHSKQSTHHEAYTEADRGLNAKGYGDEKYNRADAVGGRGYNDSGMSRQTERRLNSSEGIRGKGDDLLDTEVVRIHYHSDEKERNSPTHIGAFQRGQAEDKFGRANPQHPVLAEAYERPKLKLLPRSKPLETPDQPHGDLKQVHLKPVDHTHSESTIEVHGSEQVAVTESGNQMVERPKLNLKPRSQPIEQLEGITDQDRNASVFGGARPRELVLKERGVDEVLVNSYDLGQSSNISSSSSRPKINVASGKVERQGGEESWKNAARNGEEEIWRKAAVVVLAVEEEEEVPKKAAPGSGSSSEGIRFGKAASAAELAQAFSRSCSVIPNKLSGVHQRGGGVPKEGGQTTAQQQVPFSRLMGGGGGGRAQQQQINGY